MSGDTTPTQPQPLPPIPPPPVLIGFSTRKWNPLSMLIRWVTGSKFSHAWLLFDVMGVKQVLEATEWGYRLMSWELFQKKNLIVKTIDPQWDLTPGVKKALTLLGTPYDFFALLGMLFVVIGRKLKKRLNNPFANTTHNLFCSEAVVDVCQWAGMPAMEGLDPERIGPEDLDLLVEKGTKPLAKRKYRKLAK